MCPKSADRKVNSVDSDQDHTAPLSGSELFAKTCLSKNLDHGELYCLKKS